MVACKSLYESHALWTNQNLLLRSDKLCGGSTSYCRVFTYWTNECIQAVHRLQGRASTENVGLRLSYIGITPTFYILILRFVVVLRYWLTYGHAVKLLNLQRAGMVGPVEYVKTNNINNIFKFIERPHLNTYETSL